MLELIEFDQTDYERYPCVENLFGDLVPLLARVKMAPPHEGWLATVVVDGNGILVMIYNEEGEQTNGLLPGTLPLPFGRSRGGAFRGATGPESLNQVGF